VRPCRSLRAGERVLRTTILLGIIPNVRDSLPTPGGACRGGAPPSALSHVLLNFARAANPALTFGQSHASLRRRTQVGEGAVTVPVDDQPGDLAILELKHGGGPGPPPVDVDPARAATSEVMDQHEHPVIAKLPVLLSSDADILKGADPLAPCLRHRACANRAPRFRSISNHELDLRVRPISPAEVPAFPGRVNRAHQVQVLRGHRLSVAEPPSRRRASPERRTRLSRVRETPDVKIIPACVRSRKQSISWGREKVRRPLQQSALSGRLFLHGLTSKCRPTRTPSPGPGRLGGRHPSASARLEVVSAGSLLVRRVMGLDRITPTGGAAAATGFRRFWQFTVAHDAHDRGLMHSYAATLPMTSLWMPKNRTSGRSAK
jgi:hypothetical protein